MTRKLLWLAALVTPAALSVLACAGPGSDDSSSPRTITLREQPPSSLAALVRVLEALDAQQYPGISVRLRAIEVDSLDDHRRQEEYARVLLHLTAFAADFESARLALEEIGRTLSAEAAARARPGTVEPHRIARVFDAMAWTPRAGSTARFEDLVSISDTLRFEVRAGAAPPPVGSSELAADGSDATTQLAVRYIEDTALDPGVGLGPVDVAVTAQRRARGWVDVRYRVRPFERETPHERLAIGSFLHRLEAGSPGVRITHIGITPAALGATGTDAWTFEADMTVRIVGA